MLTSNVFLHLTVLCWFQSARGLLQLRPDIALATEVLDRVTGQIAAVNDSNLQEFAEIFDYFLNLTQLENEGREEVNRLTASNSTEDGDDDAWQTAINDAWAEENITGLSGFNDTLTEEVVEYIETFVSKPENLKLTYSHLHNLSVSRREEENGSTDSEEEETQFNPYWDLTLTRRIYKGVHTKIKLFPFVASVLMFNTFACAGAIIKSDLVITAASCLQLVHNNRFFRENPAFLSVRVGSIFFSVGGDHVPVTEVYFHPSYEPLSLHNNLAIVRLRRLLNFRHRRVKKIDFDRHAAALPFNSPGITIVGWGAKDASNRIAAHTRIQAVELDYYDFDTCKEIYGKKFVTRTNFCAGFFSKGEGACNRDVGDPGVLGRFLVGVTSFGSPQCGKADTPTVFTKLGYYTDWIEEIMAQKTIRVSHSTTTKSPFVKNNKHVKLYGGPEEDKPIPILREFQDSQNEDVINEPVDEDPAVQELPVIRDEASREVDPDIDVDPEIILAKPDKESLRIHPPTIIETGNELVDYNNIQSEEDSEDELTTESVQSTTSIFDLEPTQHDTDTDVKSVGRTMQSAEMDYKMDAESVLDPSDTDDSTKKPVTEGMVNDDLEENMSNSSPEMEVNTADDYTTTSMNENQDVWVDEESYTTTDNIATTSWDENQDVLVDKENPTAQRKKHHMPPVDSKEEVTNYSNQTDNQLEQINNSISANIGENIKSTELGEIREKIEDIGENDEPEQSKFQEESADDMVKREIQKLIKQLEISDEMGPNKAEEHTYTTTYTPLRYLVNNMSVNDAKTPESVLTFLYLTDNEKHVSQRASANTEDEEGLSIDPAPFRGNVHMRSELLAKSEIYEILAKVMDTVVNKTTG